MFGKDILYIVEISKIYVVRDNYTLKLFKPFAAMCNGYTRSCIVCINNTVYIYYTLAGLMNIAVPLNVILFCFKRVFMHITKDWAEQQCHLSPLMIVLNGNELQMVHNYYPLRLYLKNIFYHTFVFDLSCCKINVLVSYFSQMIQILLLD